MFLGIHNHDDHSNYRLRDSTNTVKALIEYTHKLGHKGIAITDHETVGSAFDALMTLKEFKDKSPEEWKDYKLILGNEIYLCNRKQIEEEKQNVFPHFILLAKDAIGHKQIRELSTRAWVDNSFTWVMKRVPTYYDDLFEVLGANKGHVIGSTACLGGILPQNILKAYKENPTKPNYSDCIKWIKCMKKLFGEDNFYLELQPSTQEDQFIVDKVLIQLSKETDTPYVISTDAHYLKKEDKEIHAAFINSQDGDRELGAFYDTTYVMSETEIHEYLDKVIGYDAVEIGFSNTIKIANLCEEYTLEKPLNIPYIPSNTAEPNYKLYLKYLSKMPLLQYFFESKYDSDRHLVREIVNKFEENQEELCNQKTYDEMQINLKSIKESSDKANTRWSGYLLQTKELIQVCWDSGSLVCPSRGSGGGFLLLYILDIIQINPIREKAKTAHWRFLNPERVSVLDIDVDIEGNKRDLIINRLKEKYGGDRHISKVQTLLREKSKSAILTACFEKGEEVVLANNKGIKKIEDITSFDTVYTLNGVENVITPTSRNYIGDIYEIKGTSGFIGSPIHCTEDHRFLLVKDYKKYNRKEINGFIRNYIKVILYYPSGEKQEFSCKKDVKEYVERKKLCSGTSLIKYGKSNGYKIQEIKDLSIKRQKDFFEQQEEIQVEWVEAKDMAKREKNIALAYIPKEENKVEDIYFPHKLQCKNKGKPRFIKEYIKIDENFCEFLGMWFAEGNINHDNHGITFTINVNEEKFKKRITYLLEKVFGLHKDSISFIPKKNSLGLSVQINSTPLGNFFYHFINEDKNKNCYEKSIPLFLKNIEYKKELAIIKGMFIGDGTVRKRRKSTEVKYTTTSLMLAMDYWRILARQGINCSCVYEQRKNPTYNLCIYSGVFDSFYKIKKEDLFSRLLINLNKAKKFDKDFIKTYNGKCYAFVPLVAKKVKENVQEEVFCISVPSQNFVKNNIIVHNCRGLGVDNDVASYLASFIKSERGIQHNLHQTYYGDEDNNIAPDKEFQRIMNEEYPEVWEVAQKIEGLINGTGQHAGGVILCKEDIVDDAALMRTNSGDIITQFDLHNAEKASLIKWDLLATDAQQKIHICLDLLLNNGRIKDQGSLKETYSKYLGIYTIDRTSSEMWNMIRNHKVFSFFQMEQQSGYQAIELGHPETVEDLAALNSVMRLMAQSEGAETPLQRYARFRKDISLWYQEMEDFGLTKEEQEIVKKYAEKNYGLLPNQEDFMMIVQDPVIGGMSLLWADKLRKSIAKKSAKDYVLLEKEFYENMKEKKLSEKLCHYVWDVLIAMNRGSK